MNTPKLPIIVFALLGLSIIAFQYTQNAKLKKELKDQSSKEIGSSGEGSLTMAGTGKGVSKSSSDSNKESVSKKDSKSYWDQYINCRKIRFFLGLFWAN